MFANWAFKSKLNKWAFEPEPRPNPALEKIQRVEFCIFWLRFWLLSFWWDVLKKIFDRNAKARARGPTSASSGPTGPDGLEAATWREDGEVLHYRIRAVATLWGYALDAEWFYKS